MHPRGDAVQPIHRHPRFTRRQGLATALGIAAGSAVSRASARTVGPTETPALFPPDPILIATSFGGSMAAAGYASTPDGLMLCQTLNDLVDMGLAASDSTGLWPGEPRALANQRFMIPDAQNPAGYGFSRDATLIIYDWLTEDDAKAAKTSLWTRFEAYPDRIDLTGDLKAADVRGVNSVLLNTATNTGVPRSYAFSIFRRDTFVATLAQNDFGGTPLQASDVAGPFAAIQAGLETGSPFPPATRIVRSATVRTPFLIRRGDSIDIFTTEDDEAKRAHYAELNSDAVRHVANAVPASDRSWFILNDVRSFANGDRAAAFLDAELAAGSTSGSGVDERVAAQDQLEGLGFTAAFAALFDDLALGTGLVPSGGNLFPNAHLHTRQGQWLTTFSLVDLRNPLPQGTEIDSVDASAFPTQEAVARYLQLLAAQEADGGAAWGVPLS